MSLIEVKNVSYTYQGKYQKIDAIKNVSCTFNNGKLYALKGASGSGKTTLLSLLAGLDLPTEGTISYKGLLYNKSNVEKLRRCNISIIFQSFNLFPLLTAAENVMYPIQLLGKSANEAKERAFELLKNMGLKEDQFKKYPAMFSGGEQQRIAIARALASGAEIILADEPTGNLDSENGQMILDIFKNLIVKENYCVILVTHDINIAEQADVLYNLKDGRLFEKGILK